MREVHFTNVNATSHINYTHIIAKNIVCNLGVNTSRTSNDRQSARVRSDHCPSVKYTSRPCCIIVHFDTGAEGDYLAHVTVFARAKRVRKLVMEAAMPLVSLRELRFRWRIGGVAPPPPTQQITSRNIKKS